MKNFAQKLNWILSAQFGVDLRRMLRSLRGLPRYIADLRRFRVDYKGPLELRPCLYDWYEEGGATRDEYFWQDLHVARQIFKAAPVRHVDVGSRVDGFVAHVASFREIEVFDVRPNSAVIPGVVFRQADLMSPAESLVNCCDSLSCLHALEHFGLGRYGDPLNAKGHMAGLAQMARLLKPRGVFYLSVPIGRERVEFNANRVFEPRMIVVLAAQHGLELSAFAYFDASRRLVESVAHQSDLADLGQREYALGLFTFTKA